MIKSFKDDATEKVYRRTYSKRHPQDVQKIGLRKLRMLNNAKTLKDLRSPPGNRLEKLSGDRDGQYSIRINNE